MSIFACFWWLSISAQNGYWYHSEWIELKPVDSVLNQDNGNLVSIDETNEPMINSAYEIINKEKLCSSYKVNLRVTPKGDTTVVLPRIFAKIDEDCVAQQICKTYKDKLQLDSCTSCGIYKFNCNAHCDNDVLRMVDIIAKMAGVEWCEPNLMVHIRFNNTLYPQQYYLKNTGQNGGSPGVDINVESAWQTVNGSPRITVAVIDAGVDTTHEDLAPNVLTGYTVGVPSGNGMPIWGDVLNDVSHGTACAGIIGAIDNDIGIRGVASGVKILPVNTGVGEIDDEDIEEAINWASPRADILSCSWILSIPNSIVENAINYACTHGRGGKGCVVVFSSGNDPVGRLITFPADIANVITVGAVNKNGIVWIYSCRGDSLDLVAPSGNMGNGNGNGDVVSTDISGINGYSTGNYCDNFGGTSAAAAQVAGVAALMLSTNPTLTQHRVREILRETAIDLGVEHWDHAYGYGLVNA